MRSQIFYYSTQKQVNCIKWSSDSACKAIILLQPSSAAAERFFSLLANSFKDTQTRALEDYIGTSVMLQYNEK